MDWTVLGFVVAAGIWWIYFDITAPSSARELPDVEEEETRSRARTRGTPTATSATPGTTCSSTVICR
ncbi:MAG TPA: hypothetical protein VF086_17220 [Propionibacteriaceae bacterium]